MRSRCSLLLLVAALTGLISCKNEDNVFKTVLYTGLNLVNASADTVNLYLNGTRQNNSSSLLPTTYSGYLTVPSGMQSYQFKKPRGAAALFGVSLSLPDSAFNSLYITGESTADAFYTTDTLITTADTLPTVTKVRFVNASPDAGNLTVYVGDTVNFKTRAFKSTSVFLTVGSGQKVVKVFKQGNTVATIDTTITMQPEHEYTVYSKGLLNGTGNSKFNVGVVINN